MKILEELREMSNCEYFHIGPRGGVVVELKRKKGGKREDKEQGRCI